MKLVIEMTRNGDKSKTTTSTAFPENIQEMATNMEQYNADKNAIAIELMAMAFGLHSDSNQLIAAFNLKSKFS